uniref:Ovule protein n=1 Tax=Haemonchus placei TaxID=6290 RepID=A0A0N4X8Z4_HAEPC
LYTYSLRGGRFCWLSFRLFFNDFCSYFSCGVTDFYFFYFFKTLYQHSIVFPFFFRSFNCLFVVIPSFASRYRLLFRKSTDHSYEL